VEAMERISLVGYDSLASLGAFLVRRLDRLMEGIITNGDDDGQIMGELGPPSRKKGTITSQWEAR